MAGEKKKVLIALYYYHPYVSGVSIYAKRVAEDLVKRGFSVTVLTSKHEKELSSKEIINGVKVIRRPVLLKLGKGVVMPTFWIEMIVRTLRHDFFNPHLPMAEVGLSTTLIRKKKIITTYQCDINLGEKKLDKIITKISLMFMKAALFRSSQIITLSTDYFESSKMSGYAHKAIQVYPPISHKEFKKTDFTKLQKKLGLAPSQNRVGFAGRIVYEKGLSYLLDSIKHLEKKYSDIQIIIVGNYENVAGGSIKRDLDGYMEKYPGKIFFTGHLSDADLRAFYSMIDVLVLPSIDPLEAFGIVQVEAMLCGTPVVASDLPGVREVVRRTGYGRLAKPKDPQDIASKISEVLANRNKFAPERKKVIEIFNIEKTISQYEELFK